MSQCATCHAGCCRSFAVPVSGADILRIMSRRGLDFWDFVCRWEDSEGLIAANHAPHFLFQDEPQTPFAICLRHGESATFPGTTKCQFLTEGSQSAEHPLGIAHCGIYEDRPGACRAFPAKLNRTGELAILYDVPPTGRRNVHPAYRLCAQAWEPADLDPVQQVQDLVVAKYEMDFFHRLAESWNEQPGAWSTFPEFLQLVYGRRILSIAEGQALEAAVEEREEAVYPRLAA